MFLVLNDQCIKALAYSCSPGSRDAVHDQGPEGGVRNVSGKHVRFPANVRRLHRVLGSGIVNFRRFFQWGLPFTNPKPIPHDDILFHLLLYTSRYLLYTSMYLLYTSRYLLFYTSRCLDRLFVIRGQPFWFEGFQGRGEGEDVRNHREEQTQVDDEGQRTGQQL